MPWHGNSEYAHPGHFRALSREERARWRFLADTARARQRITAIAHDVAMALLHHHSQNGRCDPGHARLAQVARCSERSVRNALAALKACGLLAWTRRIVRTVAGARQTSSAFRLLLGALATQRPRPDGKSCRGTRTVNIFKRLETPQSDVEAAAQMAGNPADAAEALRRIRAARAGIVAPPKPTHSEATTSLADIRSHREKALADAIQKQRQAIRT